MHPQVFGSLVQPSSNGDTGCKEVDGTTEALGLILLLGSSADEGDTMTSEASIEFDEEEVGCKKAEGITDEVVVGLMLLFGCSADEGVEVASEVSGACETSQTGTSQ